MTDRSPLLGPVAVVVQVLIVLDMSVTFTGIIGNWGVEANPLFAFFIQFGTYAMLGAMVGYIILVWVIIYSSPRWLRAIELGALTALHTYGVLTWITVLFVPELSVIFTPFWVSVFVSAIASIATMFAYVRFGSGSPTTAPENIEYNVR